jgi:hypothetical protein
MPLLRRLLRLRLDQPFLQRADACQAGAWRNRVALNTFVAQLVGQALFTLSHFARGLHVGGRPGIDCRDQAAVGAGRI